MPWTFVLIWTFGENWSGMGVDGEKSNCFHQPNNSGSGTASLSPTAPCSITNYSQKLACAVMFVPPSHNNLIPDLHIKSNILQTQKIIIIQSHGLCVRNVCPPPPVCKKCLCFT